MKKLFQYIPLLILSASVFSCKKDNYSPPGSYLTGHLVYNGDTIQLERNQVPFQIYQYGFGKTGSIDGTFAQDGSYSEVLFDGTYKVIIPIGQGPFLSNVTSSGTPDTVEVSLKGSQTVDIKVTPYYMIRNAQISASGGNANATFKVEKIVTDANAKDIERVSLYINKTQFASGGDNIAKTDMAGGDITDPNNISLNVAIPTLTPSQSYIYGRVGVKIANVEDMIFSPLIKISL